MIIQAGKREIKDNLYSLGPAELPVYLVDGENPALFDAGVSILGEYYVDRIREILGGRTLRYLFLSHVHFDHCGATGLIKQAYPDVVVCASGISAEIIGKPSALTLIGKLNALPGSSATQLFIPFTINRILREGEKLRLGNQLTVEVISAPGHTRDLLAYYIPERRTLIPSESVGVLSAGDYIYSEFLVDYNIYLRSLEKLREYEFDTLLMAHNYLITEAEATGFIEKAIERAKRFKNWIVELIEIHEHDLEKVAAVVKKEEYDTTEGAKQIEEAYKLNLEAKIRAVQKLMGPAS